MGNPAQHKQLPCPREGGGLSLLRSVLPATLEPELSKGKQAACLGQEGTGQRLVSMPAYTVEEGVHQELTYLHLYIFSFLVQIIIPCSLSLFFLLI